MKLLASLWINGRIVSHHDITLPDYNERGWYVQTLSADAFRNRENRLLYEANLKGKHHTPNRVSLTFDNDDHGHLAMRVICPVPLHQHHNLWDFYKAVGYDYKRKKYIEVKA